MGLFGTADVGIDLGTSSTLVYMQGQGIVLQEPSIAAVERVTGRILAVGEEARHMMGNAPGDAMIIRPLRDGVISNFDITARMLQYFFKKVVGNKRFIMPRAVVCVPSGVSEAEKRCVIEAVNEAGTRYAYLIEEPLAAAIGTGIDIMQTKGCMVLDIGGGTTDIAVISQGCVVISNYIRIAGDRFNDALTHYMRHKHSLHIGERSAEDIKIIHGRAHIDNEQRIVDIRGRNTNTGLPESIPIGINELVNALHEPLALILERVRELIDRTPPSLASGIEDTGIIITGGGALLHGLDSFISEGTNMPCRVADDPIGCVARGAGLVLEDLKTYNVTVSDYRRGQYDEA